MATLSKRYESQQVEQHWRDYWQRHGIFTSSPNADKDPYTIIIPPPNVTGVLHMGHILNNTIQDVLTRRARMQGKEACWVPGTDHASIATEAKVVEWLRQQGKSKKDISREDFLKYAWNWKEKYGDIILKQLRYMGASCDWSKTCFTMDAIRSKSVIKVFVDLYENGFIYRGKRMIHWDPKGKTALSDDEVIYKTTKHPLCYVRYPIAENPEQAITVATTRPETIMADTAICVHPEDKRYHKFKGKHAYIPLTNKKIPIIQDASIVKEFGTGCLKVTPAHSEDDYALGLKYKLPIVDILNEDGTLNKEATIYVGQDRFAARKAIIRELREKGFLEKIEDYESNVGFSERTNAVVEPRLCEQWFVSMKELCQPALENVLNDTIQLIPKHFKNTYRHWIENVRDWCISRQLWWGHRIPAYYLPDGRAVIAETPELALQKAQAKKPSLKPNDLKQDEDVLDTWFSSALWSMSVFNGILEPDNKEINYYYPTTDLVTAPEILFFWVARMILMGYRYREKPPFRQVYLTGIVRDKQRRKMSKSLGNSPDPIELMKRYGTDGVRIGMLFCSPAGNDLLFDEKLCEQGRNFANKIWNAARLILQWETKASESESDVPIIVKWFEARLQKTLAEAEKGYGHYRISQVLMLWYRLFWDDFCSVYLECIKPKRGKTLPAHLHSKTLTFLETLLKALHPFMPFITEELWHTIEKRPEGSSINRTRLPQAEPYDSEILAGVNLILEVSTALRNFKVEKKLPQTEPIAIFVKTAQPALYQACLPLLQKLSCVSEMTFTENTFSEKFEFIVQTDKITVDWQEGALQSRDELESELRYAEGFLKSVMAKLTNEKFVKNAPAEVVQREQKKKRDALKKIELFKKRIEELGNS